MLCCGVYFLFLSPSWTQTDVCCPPPLPLPLPVSAIRLGFNDLQSVTTAQSPRTSTVSHHSIPTRLPLHTPSPDSSFFFCLSSFSSIPCSSWFFSSVPSRPVFFISLFIFHFIFHSSSSLYRLSTVFLLLLLLFLARLAFITFFYYTLFLVLHFLCQYFKNQKFPGVTCIIFLILDGFQHFLLGSIVLIHIIYSHIHQPQTVDHYIEPD